MHFFNKWKKKPMMQMTCLFLMKVNVSLTYLSFLCFSTFSLIVHSFCWCCSKKTLDAFSPSSSTHNFFSSSFLDLFLLLPTISIISYEVSTSWFLNDSSLRYFGYLSLTCDISFYLMLSNTIREMTSLKVPENWARSSVLGTH